MDIVLKGIVSGLVLALLIGPVFFTIIQTSLERGFRSGAWVALGVSMSDAMYIVLAYFGLSALFADPVWQEYLGYGGGLILIGFGAYYLIIKTRKLTTYDVKLIEEKKPLRLAAKGFVINGLSPMVLVFWLGTVSIATGELGYRTPVEALTFFSSIVFTVFFTDLMKAKLADQLRQLITSQFIRIMNIILGVVMLAFGLRLLLSGTGL
jgi:threonine/homoserine/homoserine lactone efflux protein